MYTFNYMFLLPTLNKYKKKKKKKMQFVILFCNSVLGQINLTFCFTGETWKNSVWAGAIKMKMS